MGLKSDIKLNRATLIGLVIFAAGLHLYGWFAAQLECALLPFEEWNVLSYVLIVGGVVTIANSLKQKRSYFDLIYVIGVTGMIMVISASFTTLMYSTGHDIHDPGHGIIGVMRLLLELNAPIVPFVWGMLVLGVVLALPYVFIKTLGFQKK